MQRTLQGVDAIFRITWDDRLFRVKRDRLTLFCDEKTRIRFIVGQYNALFLCLGISQKWEEGEDGDFMEILAEKGKRLSKRLPLTLKSIFKFFTFDCVCPQ